MILPDMDGYPPYFGVQDRLVVTDSGRFLIAEAMDRWVRSHHCLSSIEPAGDVLDLRQGNDWPIR